jgi:hypothetical protein
VLVGSLGCVDESDRPDRDRALGLDFRRPGAATSRLGGTASRGDELDSEGLIREGGVGRRFGKACAARFELPPSSGTELSSVPGARELGFWVRVSDGGPEYARVRADLSF